MRKLTVLVTVALLSPFALLADPESTVTSVSPTQVIQFDAEQLLTINGTNLLGEGGTLVKFIGHGPQIVVEPNAASPTQLVVGIPLSIVTAVGNYHVLVLVFDAEGHSHALDAKAFDVVPAPPPLPEPPPIFAPEHLIAESTGPTGAVVAYTVTATSVRSGPRPVTCTPPPGTLFPLGTSNVHCEASDANGTTMVDFPVIVTDTTPPTLTVPSDITTTDPVVNFTATAIDLVDGPITPVCTPSSGSTFPVGTTEVVCTATDSSLNEAVASFFVTVLSGQ